MANSSLNLTSLDFDTLKTNLKNFLKSQSTFSDYDFDGSNMNVLLDVLSYNSFLNAFYLNMIGSEMFLDTAQKYNSIVSHAKELNYTPQSNRSSVGFITFTASTTGLNGQLTIPKGSRFSGTNSNGVFSFTTNETKTYLSTNNVFYVANLALYDGVYANETFVVDYTIQNQAFVMSNPDIDTESLAINVIENNGQTNTIFTKVDTLYNLNSNSAVYFLQGAQNGNYEILFGDGILGRKPQNGAVINAEYRRAKGSPANGITKFIIDINLGNVNGGQVNPTSVITVANSTNGSMAEDIETVRFRAPRYFATQQRAVSVDDYSSLIYTKFGGLISDINVYGGETLSPKQYGTVVICLKPTGVTYAPNYLKNQIVNYIQPYTNIPIKVITSDPDYFYLKVNTTVQYDQTLTNKSQTDIQSAVLNSIIGYSINNLEHFKDDFRFSRFTNKIDNTDVSVVSNDTEVLMVKRINTTPGISETITVNYNNAGEYESYWSNNNPSAYLDEPTLWSSSFSYISNTGTQYNNCYLRDDNRGNLFIYNITNNSNNVVINDTGTLDYTTGKVVINNFNVLNYGNNISFYYKTMSKDIYATGDKILLIDPADVSVSVIHKLD